MLTCHGCCYLVSESYQYSSKYRPEVIKGVQYFCGDLWEETGRWIEIGNIEKTGRGVLGSEPKPESAFCYTKEWE